MAQGKQLTWSELRVGLFVLAGIVVVGVAIFYVTGTGALSAKYRLVTYLPEVDGLTQGALVTLDGVEAGSVDSINIRPHRAGEATDVNHSVQVVLRINRSFQDYIRTDSVASLVTEGFLGNREVTLQRGYTGRVLQDGDQVPGTEEKAIKQIVERGADLMDNLAALSTQVGSIVNDLQKGHGTLGKLLVDQTAFDRANDALKRLDDLTTSIQEGQGSLGKLVASDALYNKADSAVGHADNVLAAVEQQKGTLGKLVYDSSIHDSAKEFLANSNGVLSDMRAGRGTLGKLATDDTLFSTWRQTGQNLQEATAKFNSNQTNVGKLFSDPQLYDNLTGLSGDLRLLIGDFRTDPKKFLHVKFSLF